MAATKGYLGPLGDDFPAIFPIAMGLLFFFSAITLTYNYYNEKHDTAILMEANTALGKAARTQLVFDETYWTQICDTVDKTKANYGVRAKLELLEFDGKRFNKVPNSIIPKKDNPCVDVTDDSNPPQDLPYPGDFFISLTYPVLIESGTGNDVATLRVTTWM